MKAAPGLAAEKASPAPIRALAFQTSCVKCPVAGENVAVLKEYALISSYHMPTAWMHSASRDSFDCGRVQMYARFSPYPIELWTSAFLDASVDAYDAAADARSALHATGADPCDARSALTAFRTTVGCSGDVAAETMLVSIDQKQKDVTEKRIMVRR